MWPYGLWVRWWSSCWNHRQMTSLYPPLQASWLKSSLLHKNIYENLEWLVTGELRTTGGENVNKTNQDRRHIHLWCHASHHKASPVFSFSVLHSYSSFLYFCIGHYYTVRHNVLVFHIHTFDVFTVWWQLLNSYSTNIFIEKGFVLLSQDSDAKAFTYTWVKR